MLIIVVETMVSFTETRYNIEVIIIDFGPSKPHSFFMSIINYP